MWELSGEKETLEVGELGKIMDWMNFNVNNQECIIENKLGSDLNKNQQE